MEQQEETHWADRAASRVIEEKGDKTTYVCASGISPSGVVHIGNFREIMTTYLVSKALQDKKKKVRFIYSWDDFDAFRKVPADIPRTWEQYLGLPLTSVADPWKCHDSYAAHFKNKLEEEIAPFQFPVEFISQTKHYRSCIYAEEIKKALNHRKDIITILNKFREEPLPQDWIPLEVFCTQCGKNDTRTLKYDEKYLIHYECDCGHSEEIDFRKQGNIKLLWRVDWPMRWHYEHVDFEPGGKDHSTAGGSFDTGKEIVKTIWKRDAPTYQMYDFIRVKGTGGKISSSAGNALTVKDVLEIYEPRVILWMFANYRPNSEFAISFDLDVLKIYEDFDRCERIYYGTEKVDNKEEAEKQKRIYELSMNNIPETIPDQPTFRHLTLLTQVHEGNIDKAIQGLKGDSIKARAQCAWNWVQEYAPDDMRFKLHHTITKEIREIITPEQQKGLKLLAERFAKNTYDHQTLFNECYTICQELNIKNTVFFEGAYLALIGKKRGPKLTSIMLALEKERLLKLLSQI
ncbi:MAG TPA: lysine--tRNA ligase [Candidatus Nanoarchaeia archaeon]|nr:lysine--tRNA ligase [Candidatus Nanoarchaeia archaeon]